ncbi:MAG: glycosyltransferase [Verrucomicrobiota bacterium]
MNILFTNFRMADRTGSEVYLADLSRLFVDHGHQVGIFASKVGRLAEELVDHGVCTYEHPDDLPFKPDVIHGQYNLETMIALMTFPSAPAVYHCHSHLQRREHPPIHPRLRRYLALTTKIGDWLTGELGLIDGAVAVTPSFVDFERFGEPRRVPEKPVRALVYDKGTAAGKHLDTLSNSCICAGIELDVLADLVGKTSTRPEKLLPNYDLVFATGRAALEALATGCGVITANGGRFGELVTTNNLATMRESNFSVSENDGEQSVELLLGILRSWDWRSLAPVASRLRKELAPETVLEAHLQIYKEVIEEYSVYPEPPEAEFKAMADWLMAMADQHHSLDSGFLEIQSQISQDAKRRKATERKHEFLSKQLQTEREKVRAARRALFEGGNLATRGLRKRLEGEWKEIQKQHEPSSMQFTDSSPEIEDVEEDKNDDLGVELSG